MISVWAILGVFIGALLWVARIAMKAEKHDQQKQIADDYKEQANDWANRAPDLDSLADRMRQRAENARKGKAKL